jgi:hypothetical protein
MRQHHLRPPARLREIVTAKERQAWLEKYCLTKRQRLAKIKSLMQVRRFRRQMGWDR